MATSVLCPVCHTPLPPGNRRQCRACRRQQRSTAPKQRRAALALGATVAVALLALACWLGTSGWRQIAGHQRGPCTVTVASATAAPAPVAEVRQPALSIPETPTAAAEEEDSALFLAEPPPLQAPLSVLPVPEIDARPELIPVEHGPGIVGLST